MSVIELKNPDGFPPKMMAAGDALRRDVSAAIQAALEAGLVPSMLIGFLAMAQADVIALVLSQMEEE
jgi:hypothetical protein